MGRPILMVVVDRRDLLESLHAVEHLADVGSLNVGPLTAALRRPLVLEPRRFELNIFWNWLLLKMDLVRLIWSIPS